MFSVVSVSYSVCLHGHVQACSLGYSPVLALTRTSSLLPNMLKLVHYAAHTSTGKQTVGLGLKDILVISVPFQITLHCLIKQVDDLDVTFTENADFYTDIKGSILSAAMASAVGDVII